MELDGTWECLLQRINSSEGLREDPETEEDMEQVQAGVELGLKQLFGGVFGAVAESALRGDLILM